MTALPVWIDAEAWAGYVDMRRAMKKPMTARAESLVLKTLFQLKEKGHDANAALDQSTVHNWIDVYEPKEKPIANLVKTYYEPEARLTAEQIAKDRAGAAKVLELVKTTFRKIA